MSKRFRLTKASKILIVFLIVALIGGGVFAGLKTGFIKTKTAASSDVKENVAAANKDTSSDSGTPSSENSTKSFHSFNVKSTSPLFNTLFFTVLRLIN